MLLLLFILAFALLLAHQFWYRRRGLPPGPLPLPLVGNVHSLWSLDRWEEKFLEWKDTYGEVYTYWLGPTPIVAVNTYEKAVQLFVRDGEFADRVPLEALQQALNGGVYGVLETSGPLWVEQRRFSLRVLRDFGLGKNKMEERIVEEVETLFEHIDNDIKSGVREHDLHMQTDIATGSVINVVLNGFRFTSSGNEAKFYKLKAISAEILKSFTDPIMMLCITSERLLGLPMMRGRFEKFVALFREITDWLEEIVEQHETQLKIDGEVEPRDFVDAYLIEQKRLNERGDHHYFSRLQLLSTLADLWFAGQESTSSTVTWNIAYLVRNPDVQSKLHAELDRVIGSGRLITVADRSSLPYTNAVILESQRMANITTQNIFRTTPHDVEIDGYTIKKGTIVIPQLSVMAIDPENFTNPQQFDPSRFIDEKGQLRRYEALIPFSLGKRACVGESLAKMELFLFTANIFNRYKISAGKKPPTLKKLGTGVGFSTEPYKCRIEARY